MVCKQIPSQCDYSRRINKLRSVPVLIVSTATAKMKRRMLILTTHILCIVQLASSLAITNVSGTSIEEEELPEGFVTNGKLIATWSENLTELTEEVNLSNLGINTLFESTFTKFPALYEINLSSNKLASTVNVVAALKNARPLSLNLSHNNLGSPDYDWPGQYDDRSYKQNKTFLFDSQYFWSIDLSYNSFVGIGIDFDVVHLNLSHNLMQCHNAIEPRRFSVKPTYVGNLDLSHNLINCQNRLFTPNIDTLDMSYNKLTGLDIGLFEGLRALTKLNLEHNNIRYIHPRAFMDSFSLQHVNLRSNQIREIYKQVWFPSRSLRNIDLSLNKLEYLEWDMTVNRKTPRLEVNVVGNKNMSWSLRSEYYFNFCTIDNITIQ